MNKQEIESVCTYCGVGCDITGVVENNKITKIYAKKDGIVSQGNLCIKGRLGYDFVDSPNRITQPRIKKSFMDKNPQLLATFGERLTSFDSHYYTCNLDTATSIAAHKLQEIKTQYGSHSFCAIGGARTNCESAYLFQKFTRQTMGSPHVDNCARVCHSPSLKGMRTTIGEGAATNPYNDIYECEFMIVMGSNTIEAHPIVANRIVAMANEHNNLAVIDVRHTKLAKFAKYNAIIPFESNLLILNMMAYVIITQELYDKSFIASRSKGFEEFKAQILSDPYANPEFFATIEGYEHLASTVANIAREYAFKRSMIFWGLGITEHLDGSYAVMAITHLAIMTGNIGKIGAGLMPLRGQNNVQGACDMGCLPYYNPDYQRPLEKGLMTPQLLDAMMEGKIKALLNMGEDITHIHTNINKVEKAIENLEFIMTQELFMTQITQKADIVIGVRSAYEKTGVYINAMRRLHLSQPLVHSPLPDDWEVIQMLDNKLGGKFNYQSPQEVWEEVTQVASNRFSGAAYYRLERHRKRGMQWPIYHEDTPILHLLDFRTLDGLARFSYHPYELRGMVKEILEGSFYTANHYYLTTGRILAHYNNTAQTKQSEKLNSKYPQDIVLASYQDKESFAGEWVILKTQYGETSPLKVEFSDNIKPKTLYTTFHHAASRINAIFGDECDALILTPRFKSIRVEIVSL